MISVFLPTPPRQGPEAAQPIALSRRMLRNRYGSNFSTISFDYELALGGTVVRNVLHCRAGKRSDARGR